MQISPEKATLIRDQLKKEQESWHHTQRYGLFSYLPDHGFGHRDEQTKPSKRDETGAVTVAPRNFAAGRVKKSHVNKDAFTQCGYLSQNDEYVNPTQTMRYREQNSNKAKQVHGDAFRPSGSNPKKIRAPYEYITDTAPQSATNSANRRGLQSAGSPKNFATAPLKRGKGNNTVGHLFATYDYVPDPYDNPNQMSSHERREHADKILNGPFQLTYKKRDHFTPNMHVYRERSGMNSTKSVSFSKSATGFRPAFKPFLNSNPPRKGYNCTINKFPDYKEEGVQYPENKGLAGSTLDANATSSSRLWKHTYREKSVPTISIQQYNSVNRPRHKF